MFPLLLRLLSLILCLASEAIVSKTGAAPTSIDWQTSLKKILKNPAELQPQLLYPAPPKQEKTAYREKYKSLLKYERTFTCGDQQLHGWLFNRKNTPLIVYYGANNEDVTQEFWWMKQQKNFSFLLVNYRGYGLSTGQPAEKDCVEDAVKILDQIARETKRPLKKIILVGRSLGTGVAVQVAARRPVGKVILITPYDSIRAVAERHFWFLPLDKYLKDTWQSALYAPKVQAKTTLIVAENDELIPRAHADNLAAQFPKQPSCIEIPGTDHANITQSPAFEQQFKKALKN